MIQTHRKNSKYQSHLDSSVGTICFTCHNPSFALSTSVYVPWKQRHSFSYTTTVRLSISRKQDIDPCRLLFNPQFIFKLLQFPSKVLYSKFLPPLIPPDCSILGLWSNQGSYIIYYPIFKSPFIWDGSLDFLGLLWPCHFALFFFFFFFGFTAWFVVS